jgi:hypothetical protein
MSDWVLIPLPFGTLALEVGAYRRALAEGAALVGAAGAAEVAADEALLTAEQLSAALGNVPITWLEAAGRDGRIPSVECGRWRRFKRTAVEAALAANGKGARA